MGRDYQFLGQNIHIGNYVGIDSAGNCAITDPPVSFSILQYFKEQTEDGLNNPDGLTVIFKENGVNTFALAYKYLDGYGWSTLVKWANTYRGVTIADNETPPTMAPWNDWQRIGSYSDPENITMAELLDNSISFFEIPAALTPYYYGPSLFEEETMNDLTRGGVNIAVVYGGDTYTGETPMLPYSDGWTNWIDQNTPTDPSYSLSMIYNGFARSYSPLNIDGAQVIDSFTDDTAVSGGGYGADYGYMGSSFGFSHPLSLNALDTGLITMFSPTKAQLRSLASFLWSDDFINNIKKAWAEPMDSIISLGIVPLDLSSIKELSSSQVYVGNVSITGCQMYKLTEQVIEVDFGSVDILLNWSNALDWEPFCSAICYLPYIGYVPLKINDIMYSKVKLHYTIDLLSGDCIAQLMCIRSDSLGQKWGHKDAVLYQHRGNCLINIPISAANYSAFYKSLTLGAINAAQGVFTQNGSAIKNGVSGMVSGLMEGSDIQRSGNYSGSVAGIMHPTPCIFVFKPIQHLPKGYSHYVGWPSYKRYKLKELSGFTVVDSLIDNTVKATDTEKIMIEKALKEGVIL